MIPALCGGTEDVAAAVVEDHFPEKRKSQSFFFCAGSRLPCKQGHMLQN